MVYRVYVEKKEALANEARALLEDLRAFLLLHGAPEILCRCGHAEHAPAVGQQLPVSQLCARHIRVRGGLGCLQAKSECCGIYIYKG